MNQEYVSAEAYWETISIAAVAASGKGTRTRRKKRGKAILLTNVIPKKNAAIAKKNMQKEKTVKDR